MKTSHLWSISIAFLGGIFLGLQKDLDWLIVFLSPFGEGYLSLLKVSVFPILMTAIITNITRLMKQRQVGYVFGQLFGLMFVFYVLSFLLSMSTLFWNNGYVSISDADRSKIIHGVHIFEDDVSLAQSKDKLDKSITERVISSLESVLLEDVQEKKLKSQEFSGLKVLPEVEYNTDQFGLALKQVYNIIPTNIYQSMVAGNPIHLIVFSIIIGLVIGILDSKRQRMLLRLTESIQQSFHKIFFFFARFFPLAFATLVANFFSQFELKNLYLMTSFLQSFYILGFVILIMSWIFLSRLYSEQPSKIGKFIFETGILIVFSRTDLMALPRTLLFYTKRYFQNRDASSFSFPLSLQLGHHGFFIYLTMASFFCAYYYGLQLTTQHYLSIFMYSGLASIFPGFQSRMISLGFLTLILESMNLPSAVMLVAFTAIDLLAAPMRALIQMALSLVQSSIIGEMVIHRQRLTRNKQMSNIISESLLSHPKKQISIEQSDTADNVVLEDPLPSDLSNGINIVDIDEAIKSIPLSNVPQTVSHKVDADIENVVVEEMDNLSIESKTIDAFFEERPQQKQSIPNLSLPNNNLDKPSRYVMADESINNTYTNNQDTSNNIIEQSNNTVTDKKPKSLGFFARNLAKLSFTKTSKAKVNKNIDGTIDEPVSISLRGVILFFVLGLLVVYGGLIGWIFYQGSRESIYRIARNMMDEISSSVAERINAYLSPAHRSLEQLNYLIEGGVFKTNNNEELLAYIKNDVLQGNRNFLNAYVADMDGNISLIKRMPDGSFSYNNIQRNKVSGKATITWKHSNNKYYKELPAKTQESLATAFDARERPWFKNALTYRLPIAWSDVYILFNESELGITCALSVFSKKTNQLIKVIGIDLGLETLSKKIHQQMNLGQLFIVDNEFELVSVSSFDKNLHSLLYRQRKSGNKTKKDNTKLLVQNHITDSKDPLLLQFYESYIGNAPKDTFDQSILSILVAKYSNIKLQNRVTVRSRMTNLETQFLFSHDGQSYLTSVLSFSPYPHVVWKMGVLLKESELMSFVRSNNVIVVLLSLMIFLISILLARIISNSISRPLKALSEQMKSLQTLDFSDSTKETKSIIYEVRQMNVSFDKMKSGLNSFKKYVPSDLVKQLMRMGTEAKIAGKKKELTMFFSDVKGFTSISESAKINELLASMDVYFNGISEIIDQHRGTIDKYIGDAIMAFWNAPMKVDDHPTLACLASLKVQEFIKTMRSNYQVKFDLPTRIGIHTDEVIVGNMGSTHRLNYTIMGDGVNLCSRLEGLNKIYNTKIIISHSTYLKVQENFEIRCLDRVTVKGRVEGVLIYQLIGEKGKYDLLNSELDKKMLSEFMQLFQDGVNFYFDRQWTKSIIYMEKAHRILPEDYPSRIIQSRAYHYVKNPPDKDWDGVFLL